jgi:hypothetical protein
MATSPSRFTDVEFLALHDAAEALDCDHEGIPHWKGCDDLPRILRAMLTEAKSTETAAKFRCGVAKAITLVAHSGCTKIEGHEGPCDDYLLLCKHCGEDIVNSRYGYRHVLTCKMTCENGKRRADGGLRSAEPTHPEKTTVEEEEPLRFTVDELALLEEIQRILKDDGHEALRKRLGWILGSLAGPTISEQVRNLEMQKDNIDRELDRLNGHGSD